MGQGLIVDAVKLHLHHTWSPYMEKLRPSVCFQGLASGLPFGNHARPTWIDTLSLH